jgi:hypothetical protein
MGDPFISFMRETLGANVYLVNKKVSFEQFLFYYLTQYITSCKNKETVDDYNRKQNSGKYTQ